MDRRSFLKGAAALFAAPAVVKAEILMPVKQPIWQPHSVTVAVDLAVDDASEVTQFYLDENGDIHYVDDWRVRVNWETKEIEINPNAGYMSVLDFHREMQRQCDDFQAKRDDAFCILDPNPSMRLTNNLISMENGYRVKQDSIYRLKDGGLIQGEEYWQSGPAVV